jgi:hypothetical protein
MSAASKLHESNNTTNPTKEHTVLTANKRQYHSKPAGSSNKAYDLLSECNNFEFQ